MHILLEVWPDRVVFLDIGYLTFTTSKCINNELKNHVKKYNYKTTARQRCVFAQLRRICVSDF